MQDLFSWDFQKHQEDGNLKELLDHLDEIDQAIKESATERPISQINKIDLAILRLATYEVIISKDAPIKVVIDEAVELAKEYGSESSPAFINGALGKLVEIKDLNTK